MNKISAVIITRNEEKNIEEAVKSLDFASEVIVVDNDSTDKTRNIAEKLGAKVVNGKFSSFSDQRNKGLEAAAFDWILYIDADERVDQQLKESIKEILSLENSKDVYKIKRKNFYFRNYEWNKIEKMERLFRKDKLKNWYGKIHESPKYEGTLGELSGFLIHYTHNDLSSMLDKTIRWSEAEADVRIESNHPKMSWWRFPRVMMTTFFNYYIKQSGFKLGTAGLVESIYQSFSTFITYAKLWEKQNKSN